MIIAVNTGFKAGGFTDNTNDLLFDRFFDLAIQHKQHQFIFIVDKDFDEKNIRTENALAIVAGSSTTNPILLQYRLNYTIPAILRKHKVDVFVSYRNCSLRCKVPQCMLINDLSFLLHPELYVNSWLRFYKKNMAKFVAHAKTIVTSSHFVKQQLIGNYKKDADAITVAHFGAAQIYKPATLQEKDAVKERYSEGVEYFLYAGPIDPKQNLILLLKAFSFFKKRQKSNMQLIIASVTAATDKSFIKSLGSFKYRNEVKVLDKLPVPALANITAGAYALVYPSVYENFAASIPAAMQCDVPVIAGNGHAIKEIYGDAVLYSNPGDFNDIADKMMLLFKDENKRNELISKGRQQAILYDRAATMTSIWEAIVKSTDASF
jgi:glycosyltransferase involved in cell wall biosynthesis